MSDSVNPHLRHLQGASDGKYPYAYGALDAAVEHFLNGTASRTFLEKTFRQVREALAEAKNQGSAVTS